MAKQDLAQLYEICRQNMYPAMLEVLSEQLGLPVDILSSIGVGYDFDSASWITPERDHTGKICGLSKRYSNGKKLMVTGSHRGLVYVLNPDSDDSTETYKPGRHNWVKATAEHRCPVCGRDHWCLLSAKNPGNPPAVICGDTEEGSRCKVGDNFLHVLTEEGEVGNKNSTVLLDSSLPVLIVEGFTDTAAGTELGFTTIGKPAANGGLSLLQQMPLVGRKVVIIGEHDSGAGVKGMEATFRSLRKSVKDLVKLMPPEGIKDLRDWVSHGLTQEELLLHIRVSGDEALGDDIFDDDVAFTVAKKWLTTCKMLDGWPLIRNYRGQWLQYDDSHYVEKTVESLRGELYGYLDGKMFNKEKSDGTIQLAAYKPTKGKVNDVFDALNRWCPITAEPPTWLDDEPHPLPSNIIVFKNGMLDLTNFEKGNAKIMEPTPAFFSLNMLPYDYDPNAESPLWEDFLWSAFNDDPEKIELLAQWMGYNLVPDMSMEKMMLLTGRPRSGKGTILECMRATLGHEQCAETSFQSLISSFGLQPLIGKLACLIGDAKSPRSRDGDCALEKILMITGGDPVTINRKGIAQLSSVHLKTRFTFAMNDLPVFSDHAMALESRLNILSFEKSFVGKEDFTLKTRLIEEAKNGKLINFALRGLKQLRQNMLFTDPESSQEMRKQFRTLSTPVVSFLDECCTQVPESQWTKSTWVEKGQLYDAWKVWCEQRGRRAGLREQFGRWLTSAAPELKITRAQIDGRRFGIYKGLTLQDWVFDELLERPGR